MKRKRQRYVTTKAITIPKGTEVGVDPAGFERRIAIPFASVSMGLTKDISARWDMPLVDAIEIGLLKEVP